MAEKSENTLQHQLESAVNLVADMFERQSGGLPEKCPKEIKKDELWAMYVEAMQNIAELEAKKRSKKPKVQDACKIILESEELTAIPIPLIAEIVATTFTSHGIPSSCSESSVRWYISQNTLKWDIKPRRLIK